MTSDSSTKDSNKYIYNLYCSSFHPLPLVCIPVIFSGVSPFSLTFYTRLGRLTSTVATPLNIVASNLQYSDMFFFPVAAAMSFQRFCPGPGF